MLSHKGPMFFFLFLFFFVLFFSDLILKICHPEIFFTNFHPNFKKKRQTNKQTKKTFFSEILSPRLPLFLKKNPTSHQKTPLFCNFCLTNLCPFHWKLDLSPHLFYMVVFPCDPFPCRVIVWSSSGRGFIKKCPRCISFSSPLPSLSLFLTITHSEVKNEQLLFAEPLNTGSSLGLYTCSKLWYDICFVLWSFQSVVHNKEKSGSDNRW